jgi:hypothetical protein
MSEQTVPADTTETANNRFCEQQWRQPLVRGDLARICDDVNFLPVPDGHKYGGLWTVERTPRKDALSARLVQGDQKLTVSRGLLAKQQ